MTENPINPAALYDYAASKNDMDSLRPEERTFLEACAWEWERLIDHGAEEWGKQFEALGIKPGVPQAPSAKPTPAAPEKPAPSSPAAERLNQSARDAAVACGIDPARVVRLHEPAAERADEGLEEEAERLREAYTNDEGSWLEWPDCHQEPWLRVARAARALRRGGVTEAMRACVEYACGARVYPGAETVDLARRQLAALDSGASVVVDREPPWCIVDDLALSGKLDYCMEAGQPARSRLRAELSSAVRERAAARAEAERLRSMSTVEMMGENLNVKHHVEEWEARCLKAEAEAERLRGERDEAKRLVDERGGYGDVTRPGWIDAPFTAAGHIPVLTADAAEHLRSYAISQESGWMAARNDLARLRSAPPTVSVVDVEAVVRDIGEGLSDPSFCLAPSQVRAIIDRATRAVSVEEVIRVMADAEIEYRQTALVRGYDETHGIPGARALAVLRLLGAREAEPARGFVVDREKVRSDCQSAFERARGLIPAMARKFTMADAADAACDSIERQRAEHAKGGGA